MLTNGNGATASGMVRMGFLKAHGIVKETRPIQHHLLWHPGASPPLRQTLHRFTWGLVFSHPPRTPIPLASN